MIVPAGFRVQFNEREEIRLKKERELQSKKVPDVKKKPRTRKIKEEDSTIDLEV